MITKDNLKSYLYTGYKWLVVILYFACAFYLVWRVAMLESECKEKDHKIITMTAEHAENINALQNELDINKGNAKVLQQEIKDAQSAVRKPQVVYKEVVKDGGSVTYTVQEKLTTGDSTLPPEALEKTDKTVVVDQPENPEATVGVYKINLYRNWELGTGFGYQDGSKYIPVSLSRNYDRNHSLLVETHFDIDKKDFNGGEVQWKVHF